MTSLVVGQSALDIEPQREIASEVVHSIASLPNRSDCALCNSLLAIAKDAVNALASGINSEIQMQLIIIRALTNPQRDLLAAYARFRAEFFRETFHDIEASRWKWLARQAAPATSPHTTTDTSPLPDSELPRTLLQHVHAH